jgi:hypothetical protein
LVRHNRHGLRHWLRSPSHFDHFASHQSSTPNPYNRAQALFHFVPDGPSGSLFVAAHRIQDHWTHEPDVEPHRRPALFDLSTPVEVSEQGRRHL